MRSSISHLARPILRRLRSSKKVLCRSCFQAQSSPLLVDSVDVAAPLRAERAHFPIDLPSCICQPQSGRILTDSPHFPNPRPLSARTVTERARLSLDISHSNFARSYNESRGGRKEPPVEEEVKS